MLNETLASKMSETGALGMADLLVRQLQTSISTETAPVPGQESAPPSTAPVDVSPQE
jgi:Rod binding domain-containing protein